MFCWLRSFRWLLNVSWNIKKINKLNLKWILILMFILWCSTMTSISFIVMIISQPHALRENVQTGSTCSSVSHGNGSGRPVRKNTSWLIGQSVKTSKALHFHRLISMAYWFIFVCQVLERVQFRLPFCVLRRYVTYLLAESLHPPDASGILRRWSGLRLPGKHLPFR